jgi:hypothetical protein
VKPYTRENLRNLPELGSRLILWIAAGSGDGRIDVVKVDVEGYETQFLEDGRNTIAAQVNRLHQALRGIDFDEAGPSFLPESYLFAQLRASGIVQIQNLAECADSDFMAIPEGAATRNSS